MKTVYEIRQIDAWHEEDGWTWNTSYHIDYFDSSAQDEQRLFRRRLAKLGIAFTIPTYVDYDGDIWEIRTCDTDEPLMAMLPMPGHSIIRK